MPWGNVRWKIFIGVFAPTVCLVALAIFLVASTQVSTQFLISLLVLGLIAQAIVLFILTRSLTKPTASPDPECNESELTFTPVFHANPLPTSSLPI